MIESIVWPFSGLNTKLHFCMFFSKNIIFFTLSVRIRTVKDLYNRFIKVNFTFICLGYLVGKRPTSSKHIG